jgi:L-rhamnose-H+ transport protein
MRESLWIGLAFALAAGVMSGGCMVPLKFLRYWKWENMWLVFSVVALLILPWTLALLLVPELSSVYGSIPLGQWTAPALFGFGWGSAQVLFGLTISRLGLALGYAIVMGFVSVLGTLVPFTLQANARTNSNIFNLSGVAAMAAGILALGCAGRLRERLCDSTQQTSRPRTAYQSAVLLAIACGLISPMLNYSFAFAEPVRFAAVRSGTPNALAGCAVWPITLTAGFLPNALYSLYLLKKNRSWKLFRFGFTDAALAATIGILWMGWAHR